MSQAPEPSSFLPLKPDVFTILLVLLDGDCHGYAMIKAAEQREGQRGQLQPGALYRMLRQMLEAGLVERLERRDEEDDRRRYYRITELGRRVAAAEARRMAGLVRISREHELLKESEIG